MTPDESCKLIDAAGGGRAFAEMLGIASDPRFAQRVSNWRRRGIPATVLLEHQSVIRRLERQLQAA